MTSAPPYCKHQPGTPSAAGVLDVGLKCPHRCLFCYYSNVDGEESLARKTFRSGAQCREIVSEMARQGLTSFDVTGGEPTLHPELIPIIRHATSLGLASRVITLGQNLMVRKDEPLFVDALIDAGVTSFLFSTHAVEEEAFKAFTNASWARLKEAMDHLDRRGFQYCLNTVVFTGNQHMLPDIARESVRHGVYAHNFILFNPYYEWKNNAKAFAVQSRYPEARPHLVRAVEILEAGGVAVNVRYAPLCAFPELRKNIVGIVGVHFDPHEWRNRAGNYDQPPAYCAEPLELGPDGVRGIHALVRETRTLENGLRTIARRGEDFKYFPEACAQCGLMEACDGLDVNYLLNNGANGPGDALVTPVPGARQHAPIVSERAAYGPAFLLKRSPFADMRAAVLKEKA
ncbi:MAG: radical SAM protein [Humidesulfovibrio sp.]|nr:radical SAM protein [Humidesulfovibrio sp.]